MRAFAGRREPRDDRLVRDRRVELLTCPRTIREPPSVIATAASDHLNNNQSHSSIPTQAPSLLRF
ncbi:protein of unknown function [Blastococcus saxobsidens DD2]|uniref:Uncharacterized protein n=1 Tax=Blastococcus saxobsidens (strain DD2) TaxID=1146883 RepID=H6RJB2_BLASD|nr:protein of unknown function [Blastococcus saxobsidens DD2]